MVNPLAMTIRTKKLAVLLRDARKRKKFTTDVCAAAMGVAPEVYLDYESGAAAPSLPELELFAFTLKVPIEHFWGEQFLASTQMLIKDLEASQIKALRMRIIGALLRQFRTEKAISMEDLSTMVEIPADELEAVESGAKQLPLPQLEAITRVLELPIERFFDTHSAVGKWREDQMMAEAILEMPEEMRIFLSKPVNRPYLDLAMRLSEMSVDKLREVAEGLLEITL
jgi:transcriptional regulator with XRE-family HTH domain